MLDCGKSSELEWPELYKWMSRPIRAPIRCDTMEQYSRM